LMIAVESENDLASKVAAVACETFSLPSSAVRVQMVSRIPRTDRGKTDYLALQELQSSADGGSASDSALAVRSSPA
jgi:hypothetical protein